jgi:hypothetical protein
MSRLIQSIVVTIALVAGPAANAITSTYEFSGSIYDQNSIFWNSSSVRGEIKVSATDYGSPLKLERLEFYPLDHSGSPIVYCSERCLPPFVATGFRSLDPPGSYLARYQTTLKNWSYFSDVNALVELYEGGGAFSLRLVALDKPSPSDPTYPVGLNLLEIQAYAVKDISPSNTVDIATIKLDGKRLTMKLQDRIGGLGFGGSFVIDTLWMGHGHTKLEIPYPINGPPHRVEAYALNVETIPGPTGDQIMLSVSYREHSGSGTSYEQTTGPWDLRMFLDYAFAPGP